jgi:hypothetical protein
VVEVDAGVKRHQESAPLEAVEVVLHQPPGEALPARDDACLCPEQVRELIHAGSIGGLLPDGQRLPAVLWTST